ncbi:peptide chain release factor N(5)-glutamine methyltransferase [Aquimarina muelleri]|uniref:peptide chain release factor N(5)-glutamine methyltransferase n=1 Tax=Aquimarina muelleri TaxID=279356 RepID=UPI003F6851E5
MKIKDLRTNFVDSLSGIYDSEEILSFFYILSEDILSLRRVDVAMRLDQEVSVKQIEVFDKAKQRLEKQEPIQYIIGEVDFYGMSFKVSPNVLIPRPETEELVDWVLKDQPKDASLAILDIGTGSGCIAISLAKNLPKARVYAIDVSEQALEVAKENAKNNKVEVTFIKEDILKVESLFQKFDIIVSNPPYVREMEKQEMKPNVLNNEPSLALFVSDKDPLLFYEKIAILANKKLNNDGVLYFEINQYLSFETKKRIEELGFTSVKVREDIYGNKRMIRACAPKK